MALPKLSKEERDAALKKALKVRKERAKLREDLKKGKVKLSQVLNKSDDQVVGRMKVDALLRSLPGVGKVRSKKIMEKIGISPTRRVQGLGKNQREALLEEFS